MWASFKTLMLTAALSISVLVLTISLPFLTVAFTAVMVVAGSYFLIKVLTYEDDEEEKGEH